MKLPLRIATVEDVIARASGVHVEDLRGRDRTPAFAEARMAVWYVAHDYLGYSYNDIARFYQRDHSTIMHGAKKIRNSKENSMKVIEGIKKVCPEVLKKPTADEARTLENWVF